MRQKRTREVGGSKPSGSRVLLTAALLLISWPWDDACALACDGKTDDTKALQCLLSRDQEVTIPAGLCKLTDTISVPAGRRLRGVNRIDSRLWWSVDVVGLRVYGDAKAESLSIQGAGRCFERTAYACKGNKPGVEIMAAHVTMQAVRVTQWSGHCIKAHCSPSTKLNCNGLKLYDVQGDRCSGDCIHINGADANAFTFIDPNCKTNDGWGIKSLSFIGGNVVGGHFNTNLLGAVTATKGGDRTTLTGVYVEGGSHSTVQLGRAALWLGGHPPAADKFDVVTALTANGLTLGKITHKYTNGEPSWPCVRIGDTAFDVAPIGDKPTRWVCTRVAGARLIWVGKD